MVFRIGDLSNFVSLRCSCSVTIVLEIAINVYTFQLFCVVYFVHFSAFLCCLF